MKSINISFLIFLLIFSTKVPAQNLVTNGDFEQLVSCPTGLSQLTSTVSWFTPTNGSPDYFHECSTGSADVPENIFGYQYAHSGEGYGGIEPWAVSPNGYREYFETQLSSPLVAGTCYYFEMYVNTGDVCQFTTDDIQVYFSDVVVTGIATNQNLSFTPQISNVTGNFIDTMSWVPVTGMYTATGGEEYIIIGNFKNNSQTDTMEVNATGTNVYIYFYIDDVTLTVCTGNNELDDDHRVSIYPNPAVDFINIETASGNSAEFLIYDAASKKLLDIKNMIKTTIDISHLEKGVYYYKLRYDDGVIKTGKVMKM
jgi:OmpA-OmpF porin, OOP family